MRHSFKILQNVRVVFGVWKKKFTCCVCLSFFFLKKFRREQGENEIERRGGGGGGGERERERERNGEMMVR